MRELEERYPEAIAVVGVHSGKYIAERETARIRDASLRLRATHPTINDRHFRLWRAYAVRAWPTLVAVDPRGAVVGMQAGEFTADALVPFVERVIGEARAAGTMVEAAPHFTADPPTVAPTTLCFPGKVAVDGRRIAIADSGHHRVLIGTLSDSGTQMLVQRIVGGGAAAYRDGVDAAFVNPQGLVLDDDQLYVADAGSHTVRAVSLASGATRTIAGIGRQLRTAVDEARGALSSPWDLAMSRGRLFVAMAGVHQIWTVDPSGGTPDVLSGSGAEELHDGPHGAAAFAQPMGICVSDRVLYVADAESSAVRAVDLDSSGGARTIVGTGLFDFGDADGEGDVVRLQHQQGVALADDGRLLICDSYNDALKWLDPATRRVTTWIRGLHEPSGVAVGERAVYVADTNAHRIVVVDRQSAVVTTLAIGES